MQYLARNTGDSTRAVEESDLRDILHISHAPYVDYLVTDRYFATTIATALARRFPNTVILRNISELCNRLSGSQAK
jgi:hypothetical protein